MEEKTYSKYVPAFRSTKKQLRANLEEDVFSNHLFKEHLKKVSLKTKMDEKIVEEVLRSYFTDILIVMNSVRNIKRKINIYGFLRAIIIPGSLIKKQNYEQ